jgi:hypothetical protein
VVGGGTPTTRAKSSCLQPGCSSSRLQGILGVCKIIKWASKVVGGGTPTTRVKATQGVGANFDPILFHSLVTHINFSREIAPQNEIIQF